MPRLNPADLDEDSLYKRILKEYKPPSYKEFTSLFLKYKSGDREAENRLTLSNFGLVLMVYNRLRKKYQIDRVMTLEEIASYGFEGIKTALERFNPSMGLKFSTYAVIWIKERITSAVSKEYKRIKGLANFKRFQRQKTESQILHNLYFEDIINRDFLSEREKEILRLHFVFGMKYNEIAEVLVRKVSESRVGQITKEALKKLKERFAPIEADLMLEK